MGGDVGGAKADVGYFVRGRIAWLLADIWVPQNTDQDGGEPGRQAQPRSRRIPEFPARNLSSRAGWGATPIVL